MMPSSISMSLATSRSQSSSSPRSSATRVMVVTRWPLLTCKIMPLVRGALQYVTTTTSLFSQVRYEMLKSAHQRELSRICCSEIEVDGLGSYPHIPGGRPHGSDSRCCSAFGREPCDRGAAAHRPGAGIENAVGRTAYDG